MMRCRARFYCRHRRHPVGFDDGGDHHGFACHRPHRPYRSIRKNVMLSSARHEADPIADCRSPSRESLRYRDGLAPLFMRERDGASGDPGRAFEHRYRGLSQTLLPTAKCTDPLRAAPER